MPSNATACTAAAVPVSMEALEKLLEELRGLLPAKWMLVSPDGRVWVREDPFRLAVVCATQSAGFLPPSINT